MCISWIVFIVHVLMLFFFNSSIGWRWTVSQTGAGAMWTTLQLAYDSWTIITLRSIFKGDAPPATKMKAIKLLTFSLLPPWIFAAVYVLVIPEYVVVVAWTVVVVVSAERCEAMQWRFEQVKIKKEHTLYKLWSTCLQPEYLLLKNNSTIDEINKRNEKVDQNIIGTLKGKVRRRRAQRANNN